MASIRFDYRITFENGQTVDRFNDCEIDIEAKEYAAIVRGIIEGHSFADIPGIDTVISKMNTYVEERERYMSINGVFRDKPLKKERVITNIEYILSDGQINDFKRFKDHLDLLDKPEEKMTVYRMDGTYVEITYSLGEVSYIDSRHKNCQHRMSSDYFLKRLI